jgi:5-methylcytosine-specific restriction protein A
LFTLVKIPGKKRENSNAHRGGDKFYHTKRWKLLKEKVWIRDEGMCQICLDKGINHFLMQGTKDMNYQGTVDHIKPRNAGGSDDIENLRLVGSRCHAKKSNQDKQYYR